VILLGYPCVLAMHGWATDVFFTKKNLKLLFDYNSFDVTQNQGNQPSFPFLDSILQNHDYMFWPILHITLNHLKVWQITARWISNLFTFGQKKERVRCAQKLLKCFLNITAAVFTKLIFWLVMKAGFNYFKQVRKCNNDILATRMFVPRDWSVSRMLCLLFLNTRGIVAQIRVSRPFTSNC
jgi:hypothetical protein